MGGIIFLKPSFEQVDLKRSQTQGKGAGALAYMVGGSGWQQTPKRLLKVGGDQHCSWIETERPVKGRGMDDQTRDAARSLCPTPMLNAPATVTAGNGANGDNESRRQRSIYTAFEKAKATHVCSFRSSREWDLTRPHQVIKTITSAPAVRKAESRARMVGPSLWFSFFSLIPTGPRIKQNLNEVENLYFRHSRKSRPESEPDESLEREEPRPLTSVLRPDNNAPSPSLSSPMDEVTRESVRPPSNGGRSNHPTTPSSIPVEETTSVTLDPDDSVPHRQSTINSAPQPSSSLATHSPAPLSVSRQPTLSSLDASAGRSPSSSSGSTLTYDSFWSSHSSSSLTYRNRLSEPSFASLKQPFTTSFAHVQKSNPIIPTLSFPSSPPSPNSLHTAMGSFHHADLALARQDNGSFFPPQP